MRKIIDISPDKLKDMIKEFYLYFENGYRFEEFLKTYLEKIGLDEVVVTQPSHDNGIDLQAIRYGVGGLDGDDSIQYYVQAKRYEPNTTIRIEQVRALRGVMNSGDKGIFITTAKYSSTTREFAKNDQTRPIILIDGKTLVESCIDNEIGFVYQPIFSKNAMDALGYNSNNGVDRNHTTANIEQPIVVVDKQITANDIRARILRMPKALINILDDNDEYVNVIFAGNEPKRLKIDKSRSYLAGVTQLYKSSGIIRDDGLYEPQKVVWKIYSDKVEIIVRGNEEMRDFNAWLSGFRDSIADYGYYIDFEKVHRNVDSVKIELNILNSLIGSKNVKETFKALIKKYPEVLKCIPLLLAVRTNEIYCQDVNGGHLYNFKNINYPEADIVQYTYFMEQTGLFDLLQNHIINNLVDYATGVETGLDSNGRKNRGGHLMEDLVENFIKKPDLLGTQAISRKCIFIKSRKNGVLTFRLYPIKVKWKNVLILWLKLRL